MLIACRRWKYHVKFKRIGRNRMKHRYVLRMWWRWVSMTMANGVHYIILRSTRTEFAKSMRRSMTNDQIRQS